jgi:hypothetical protein
LPDVLRGIILGHPKEVAMRNALAPGDYNVVNSVFKSLAQLEWFDRTDENEKACARLVLRQYSMAGLSEAALLAQCEDAAREMFTRRH